MGVLFLMPTWSAHSELWMQRMLEALQPHLAAVGALAPVPPSWRGKVPTLGLEPPTAPSLLRKVTRRLGLPEPDDPKNAGLQAALRDPAVDVVLVQYLTLALMFDRELRKSRSPLFVHCHGFDVTWDLHEFDHPDEPVFPPSYAPGVVRLANRATLIANSGCTAQKLSDIGVPADRVKVKYLGVPVLSSPPSRPPRTSDLEILYLGRLVDFKGPDLVVRAFEQACRRGLDARLTLAGDGPMRATCETLIQSSPFSQRIRLLGWVDESQGRALRDRADIFTAHNRRGERTRQEEAFGVAVVEAMADGLPVVSGRSGSLPETVVDGVTGVLVEPGDVDAHADALLALALDPALRRRMGRAAWKRAKETFSTDEERRRLQDILGLPGPAVRRPQL